MSSGIVTGTREMRFPNSLEINPYVTIMALADRVAQRIREEVPALL